MTMTPEAKRLLSRTIRSLRAGLLEDLHAATEGAYRLTIPAKDAKLPEAARMRRARLDTWVAEQVRALPAKERKGAEGRFLQEVEKDAAATLLNRIVYLRLLEGAGLRQEKVVTGGWESRGYKDFREHAPELVHGDPSEGYAYLLQLIFDDLAIDLPGLYGPVGLTELVPIPAASLRRLVEALDAPELESCWDDDMTLGWVYQYWNDPERESLDAKLNDGKKLENHELASKTQMFTERYMVEWLLHNSLGQQWLALCEKHGWEPEVQANGTLENLEHRRAEWRLRREAGDVPADGLMPIQSPAEERWKYYVPQPLPQEAVAAAPDSLRDLKLLDVAVGSGHFLVIALELLFHLHKEEGRHRGLSDAPEYGDAAILEHILEHNLHGVDIDPRAVQIAAAALMLKAQQLAPGAQPRALNLVAARLRLGNLPADDAALLELEASLEREVGLPPALTADLVHALSGADHLGTLLKVDAAVDEALARGERSLSAPGAATQGDLYEGFAPERRTALQRDEARRSLLARIENFLAHHGGGDDLGLRLRGEQLAAGIRLLRMLREGQYDLVVGNPPYQGTSKMADAKYVQEHYPRGKADLYAAFLERGLQLARDGGVSALLTMRNWMFIKQYAALREWLLQTYDLRMLGDVDRGAFDEVPNEVLAAVMSVFHKRPPCEAPSIAMQPTPLEDKSYDRERTKRKRAAVLCQVGRFEFEVTQLAAVPASPVVYWWAAQDFDDARQHPPIGQSHPVRQGLITGDNYRFVRKLWEAPGEKEELTRADELRPEWVPYIKGAEGLVWAEPLSDVVRWGARGLQIRSFERNGRIASRPQNLAHYFKRGVAFSPIGNGFCARMHMYRSIFADVGSSVFGPQAHLVCLLNSDRARRFLGSLNPTVHFNVGDVARLPAWPLKQAGAITDAITESFFRHEAGRESSVEFKRPGPSPWRYAQDWAQRAVDRPEAEPLPPYEPEFDPEPPTDHLSFALGVALGRFGAARQGILSEAPESALPHGILFLSAASEDAEHDSLAHPAAAVIREAWEKHGAAIQAGDKNKTLRAYLQTKFFADVHKKMYENRPIHFPLSSEKKSFVAYVNIHRWHEGTLRALLAEHLHPTLTRLEGEITDLREARSSADKSAAREAERRYAAVDKWRQELLSFIQAVEQCAEKGPPEPDSKTPARERDARFAPALDDGVMINSAALWPLLEPQWKDPKKWWKELASAKGKKDYDWAHLSARYFPTRVYAKCQADPSLAVAHGCFWKLHPDLAYKWELRLQDEIAPDFTLDEPARTAQDAFTPEWVQESSDVCRTAFEASHPAKVDALVEAEKKRREKKAKKQATTEAEANEDAPASDGPLLDRANDPA